MTINIPAAIVETVENGAVATRHAAGVGKIDRQSPIMSAKISEVNFNPFWTVPASVIRKDLIPKMQSDPGYLRDNKIRVFNQAGQEVQPESINWNSQEALRFGSGRTRAASSTRSLHAHQRAFSPRRLHARHAGEGHLRRRFPLRLVRLRPRPECPGLCRVLLKDTPGWDRDAIERAIASGQRIDAKFREPIMTYWVYVTAWATPEGVVQFRDDIYKPRRLRPRRGHPASCRRKTRKSRSSPSSPRRHHD